MRELREQIEVDAEQYTITGLKTAEREFQKHKLQTLEAKAKPESVTVAAGGYIVKTTQPLGQLAAFLLEPMAEDGLATWNFFDDALQVEKPFPVLRVRTLPEVLTTDAVIDAQTAQATFTTNHLGKSFSGEGFPAVTWLEDGEHYLQMRAGTLYKVHARTGRMMPFLKQEALENSLKELKDVPER